VGGADVAGRVEPGFIGNAGLNAAGYTARSYGWIAANLPSCHWLMS